MAAARLLQRKQEGQRLQSSADTILEISPADPKNIPEADEVILGRDLRAVDVDPGVQRQFVDPAAGRLRTYQLQVPRQNLHIENPPAHKRAVKQRAGIRTHAK